MTNFTLDTNNFRLSCLSYNSFMRDIRRDGIEEISLASLQTKYDDEGLLPVLKELVCPIRKLVLDFTGTSGIYFWEVPSPAEVDLYDEIVPFVDA